MSEGARRDASTRWPPFRRMLEVQAAHAAGDALVAISLAGTLFFSVQPGQARDKVGLYLLITMTPFALLSPVIGPMLDRRRGAYRTAIVVSAAGRAMLALYMGSRTHSIALYPLAFGLLVLSRTHGVSRSALVPEALPPDRSLMWANGRLALISVLAGSIAALPGAGLQKIGPSWTLRVAALVFAAGAVRAFGLPKPPSKQRARPPAQNTLLGPRLLAGGLVTAATRAALGFQVFVLAFALKHDNQGARGFAVVLIAAGAGALAGSLLAPVLRAALRETLLLYLSLGLMGVAAFVLAPGFGVKNAAILAFVSGICTSTARLGFDSLVQHDAPEEVRGRTFARYETIFQVCWVAGAGVATLIPFSGSFGLRVLGAICAGGIVFAAASSARDSQPADNADHHDP